MLRSAPIRAALAAFVATIASGVVVALTVFSLGQTLPRVELCLTVLGLSAVVAALMTAWTVDHAVGARLRALTAFLENHQDASLMLRRLPDLGNDEIGRAAKAVDALLARLTTVRVSLIDQERELVAAQEQLRLKEALATKTGELEARLRERRVLFEILRVSTSEMELDRVLELLTERLASAMRLREVAILIGEGAANGERFVVRATHGVREPESVLRRAIRPGEGIAGLAAVSRDPILIEDVRAEPRYLAFWGAVAREGSFAAVPIHHSKQLLGILVLTRPPDDPLSDVETRFFGAIADQIALAIRHAQLIEELRELSLHDALTGLANRRFLETRLSMEIERSRRFRQPLSALMIDIDHFKRLNDRCGHPVGDAALREVAEALKGAVRNVDTVARVGGEEFVVLLPRAGLAVAERVAEKLRSRIESAVFPTGELLASPDAPERLTVSVGVAELTAGDDGDRLLERADQALYLAKQQGRNRTVVLNRGDAEPASPPNLSLS